MPHRNSPLQELKYRSRQFRILDSSNLSWQDLAVTTIHRYFTGYPDGTGTDSGTGMAERGSIPYHLNGMGAWHFLKRRGKGAYNGYGRSDSSCRSTYPLRILRTTWWDRRRSNQNWPSSTFLLEKRRRERGDLISIPSPRALSKFKLSLPSFSTFLISALSRRMEDLFHLYAFLYRLRSLNFIRLL